MRALKNLPFAASRRTLIKGGLAGGFVLAFHLPLRAAPVNEPEQAPDNPAGQFAPNAFIRIDHAGKTTLVMPQVEMGQGVYTAVAMILADELDADYAQVVLEHAPPDDKLYGNPIFGIQVTGNSNSIRAFWKPLRNAGAAARAMLVQAAAAAMAGRSGKLHRVQRQGHARGQRARRWPTAIWPVRRARCRCRPNPPLKDPKDFTLIGKPLKRFDTPNKINGKVVYGIDAMLPGMKFATLAAVSGIRRQSRACRRQRGQDDSRRSANRRAGRSGRGGRRSHVGRQARASTRLSSPGTKARTRTVNSSDIWDEFARRQQTGRRGREIRRRRRQRLDAGRQARRRIRTAVPGARHHGADELHRFTDAGCLRNMDRHPGHDARAVNRGASCRPAGRQSDRAQPSARRRLRPAA